VKQHKTWNSISEISSQIQQTCWAACICKQLSTFANT